MVQESQSKTIYSKACTISRGNYLLLSPFQLLPPAPSAAVALQLDSQEGNSRAQMDVSPKGSDPNGLPLCLFPSEVQCTDTGKLCVEDILFLISCI